MLKKIKQMLFDEGKIFLETPLPEMTLKERGMYAKQLLDNPLWEQLLIEIKNDALHQCVISPARDVEGREYFWKYIKAIEQLKGKIKASLWNVSIEKKKEEHKNPTL